jgi:hypothetical protein
MKRAVSLKGKTDRSLEDFCLVASFPSVAISN